MKVYRYVPDSDNFDSLILREEDAFIRDRFISGDPIGDSWQPAELIEYSMGNQGDFPSLHRWIPALSQKAWNNLQKEIYKEVEGLPALSHPTRSSYYLLNVLSVIDCLNHESSEISYNRVTGRVSRIRHYSFFDKELEGKKIFKIPETMGLEVFVTDLFKILVEQKVLQGLILEPVFEV